MNLMAGSVLPAYGRRYDSKEAVLEVWEEGKDFIYANVSSRICSCRDFTSEHQLEARYGPNSEWTTTVWSPILGALQWQEITTC